MNMLRHVLGVLGHDQRGRAPRRATPTACLDGADLVIVGPGPGDPRDGDDPKIATFRRAVDRLLAARAAVPRRVPRPPGRCATGSGSRWPTRTSSSRAPSQRSRSTAGTERVGFYNTFVGRVGRPTTGAARRASRSRPTPRPATSTWSAARTTAASSSTPSRSSPSTATTSSTAWPANCSPTSGGRSTRPPVEPVEIGRWSSLSRSAAGRACRDRPLVEPVETPLGTRQDQRDDSEPGREWSRDDPCPATPPRPRHLITEPGIGYRFEI